MILTDFYRFERCPGKSKTRLDCTASTKSHFCFELMRAERKRGATNEGDLWVYMVDVPQTFGGNVQIKAYKSVTTRKGSSLTSVYRPDPASAYGFGDVVGTSDAILFVFHCFEVVNGEIQDGASVEMFIARGKSKDRVALYNLLYDGELEEEMNTLRAQADASR